MVSSILARIPAFVRYRTDKGKALHWQSVVQKGQTILLLALAIPMALLIRALRPLVTVRVGPLRSHTIGHFAVNTELYLCERDAGMHGRRTLDLFYYGSMVCNRQLKKMWDRTLFVSVFGKALARINRLLPGAEHHVIPRRRHRDRDTSGLLAQSPPHLIFTKEEERRGKVAIREMGLQGDAPFVCFHARDSAYWDTALPDGDWSYDSYRDSNIRNYVPGVEELTRRGFYAIRMGAVVKEPLSVPNPMIIDYAKDYRTDFLDIYLGAKCTFFISSHSGIAFIPTIFRRPVVWVDFLPLERVYTHNPDDLVIPKRLWLSSQGRLLTFREILGSEIGRFLETSQYEELGIEVIENTPEEIADVVIEMDERLKGTWVGAKEDEGLQERFWSLLKPGELRGPINSRIGAEFLRQNRDLLD